MFRHLTLRRTKLGLSSKPRSIFNNHHTLLIHVIICVQGFECLDLLGPYLFEVNSKEASFSVSFVQRKVTVVNHLLNRLSP